MILSKLIGYLGDELDVYVGVRAPEATTGYVLLDQTGSANANHIMTTTIAVQSYGETLDNAITLAESVKAAMMEFVNDPDVSAVRLESDYNFTNTETKQYRWQSVFEITHYLGGI